MSRRDRNLHMLDMLGDGPDRQRFEAGLRSELEKNGKLTAEQRAELERYLADPLGFTRDELLGSLDDQAAFRGGRPRINPLDERLKALRAQHPQATAKQLRKLLGDVPKENDGHRWDKYVARVAPKKSSKARRP